MVQIQYTATAVNCSPVFQWQVSIIECKSTIEKEFLNDILSPQSQYLYIMTTALCPVKYTQLPFHHETITSLYCRNFLHFPSVKNTALLHFDKLQRPMTFIPCGWVAVNQTHLRPSHSFPLWFAMVFPTYTLRLDVSLLVKASYPWRIWDFTAGVDKVLK